MESILLNIQNYIQDFNTGSIIIRMILAACFGGLIGLERGKNHSGVGTRTITLVCIGSCVVIIVNEYLRIKSNNTIDPTRIAAQIINGVGFLGAGSIMVTGNNRVKSLATAASLWVAAIIGIAIGSGFIYGALLGFLFTFAAITTFQKYNQWRAKFDRYIDLYLEIDPDFGMDQVKKFALENKFVIRTLHRKRQKPLYPDDICITIELDTQGRRDHSSLISWIQLIDGIHYCEEI